MDEEFGIQEHDVDFSALIEKMEAPSIIEAEPPNFDIPQRVYLSNQEEEVATVLEIQAQDRIGLLYDIFTALGKLNVQVLHARISTQAGAAIDRFHIVDASNEQKLPEGEIMETLREEIISCLDLTAPKEPLLV